MFCLNFNVSGRITSYSPSFCVGQLRCGPKLCSLHSKTHGADCPAGQTCVAVQEEHCFVKPCPSQGECWSPTHRLTTTTRCHPEDTCANVTFTFNKDIMSKVSLVSVFVFVFVLRKKSRKGLKLWTFDYIMTTGLTTSLLPTVLVVEVAALVLLLMLLCCDFTGCDSRAGLSWAEEPLHRQEPVLRWVHLYDLRAVTQHQQRDPRSHRKSHLVWNCHM